MSFSDLWNYKNAFFFAATIVTTVGYGNVYPTTVAGKLFTMLYGIIGIPGFGFLLAQIGDGLMQIVDGCEMALFGKRRRTKWRVTVFVM